MIEMKDSGIGWIGDIPFEWDVRKIKHVATLAGRIGWQGLTSDEYSDEGAYLITGVDFCDGQIRWESCVHIPEKRWEEATQIQIKEGDLLITKDGTVGKVAMAVNVPGKTSLNSGVLLIRNNESCDTRFLFWIIQSEVFWKWFRIINAGNSTIIHLYQHDFFSFSFPFPSILNQRKIANYLDRKCLIIDNIISKQEQIIEKLKEYKLSLITEAVTKGLDTDVEKNDSGIEWIGLIPNHWNLIKGHRIIKFTQNGITRRDLDKSEGQIVLRLKNITDDGFISFEDTNRIELSNDEKKTYCLANGDFLFVRVNGSKALVGKSAIFEDIGEPVAYNDHIIRVRLNDHCNPQYLKLYLMSIPGKKEIEKHTITSAGQYTISGDGLRDLYIPLPPRNEQDQIISFMDSKMSTIDKSLMTRKRMLFQLQEYKKSLIYEVVTGKKEV